MKLHPDLREFIESLNSRRVDYLIVGGHAVAFHGYPRFTGDLDLFVRLTAENAARIVQALDDFGFGSTGLDASVLTRPDQVIQLGNPPNRIDLLTSISGVNFEEATMESATAELDGLPDIAAPGCKRRVEKCASTQDGRLGRRATLGSDHPRSLK